MRATLVLAATAACLLASASAQTAGTTTYNLTLTGAANSPAITDPTVGQAFLAISFNTASNNITYQFVADNVTEILAAHIHIASSPGQNGSVSIPLYQTPFVPLPGSTSTGVLAGSALVPAVFVGPYLEVLPDYNNVNVSTVLSNFVQTGQAYAQVHTNPYPDGALKATFDPSTIINQTVAALYGIDLVDPFTGLDEAQLALVPTDDVTFTNDTTPEVNPGATVNRTASG